MPLPLVLGGIGLGAKLLGGLFGSKSKQKQAEAQRKAQEEALRAQTANWEAGQTIRGGKLDAIQSFLSNPNLKLGAGAPSYAFDPAAFATLKTRTPFAGSLPADPRKGQGYSLLSGLLGDVSDIASQAALGKLAGGGGSSVGDLIGASGPITGLAPDNYRNPWGR